MTGLDTARNIVGVTAPDRYGDRPDMAPVERGRRDEVGALAIGIHLQQVRTIGIVNDERYVLPIDRRVELKIGFFWPFGCR